MSLEWGRRFRLPTPQVSRERAAEALLVWNALIWGATFVVVKSALAGISPLYFLALRFSLATVALLVLFRGVGKGARDWKSVGAGVLIGSFLFAGYLTQTLGLRLKSATYQSLLPQGLPFEHEVVLRPGMASLRVLVVDENSGRMGSVTIPAPDLGPAH